MKMDLSWMNISEELTPDAKEQTLLILQGKCPHNQGWIHVGHGHNDDCYKCKLCGTLEWR